MASLFFFINAEIQIMVVRYLSYFSKMETHRNFDMIARVPKNWKKDKCLAFLHQHPISATSHFFWNWVPAKKLQNWSEIQKTINNSQQKEDHVLQKTCNICVLKMLQKMQLLKWFHTSLSLPDLHSDFAEPKMLALNVILITAELSQRKLAGARYKAVSYSKLQKSGSGHRQIAETDSDHKFLMAMTGSFSERMTTSYVVSVACNTDIWYFANCISTAYYRK